MDKNDTNLKEIEIGSGDQDRIMAVLAYIGPLVIISYLIAKNDPYAKFHIKQGMTLLVAEVILWFLMMTFWFLFPLWQILHIALFVLAVIGIVNATQGSEKELPLIGKYAEKFNF